MALFIGGPMDGQRVAVAAEQNYIDVATEKSLSVDFTEPSLEINYYRYKREALSCPSKMYHVFVPADFTCEQLIDTLITGYRNKP